MKYWHVFTMSISRQLAFRVNFLLGRLQNLAILLLLYSVWTALTKDGATFAGLTQTELMSYVFGIHIAKSFIFGTQSAAAGEEISNGTFSTYLTRPLNHAAYTYMRELGEKVTLVTSSIVETALVLLFTGLTLHIPHTLGTLLLFGASLFLAHLLYFIVSYTVTLFTFWSEEAVGPRFLYNWISDFTSGSYFPLFIAPALLAVLKLLPFSYLIYFPMLIFLEKEALANPAHTLAIQGAWIGVAGCCAAFLWKKGLKRYNGQGI